MENTRQLYEAVPVTEELPELGTLCVVVDVKDNIHHCIYDTNGKFARYTETIQGDRIQTYYWTGITHWLRPLPPQEDNTLAFAEEMDKFLNWAFDEGWLYADSEWYHPTKHTNSDDTKTTAALRKDFAIFTEQNKG